MNLTSTQRKLAIAALVILAFITYLSKERLGFVLSWTIMGGLMFLSYYVNKGKEQKKNGVVSPTVDSPALDTATIDTPHLDTSTVAAAAPAPTPDVPAAMHKPPLTRKQKERRVWIALAFIGVIVFTIEFSGLLRSEIYGRYDMEGNDRHSNYYFELYEDGRIHLHVESDNPPRIFQDRWGTYEVDMKEGAIFPYFSDGIGPFKVKLEGVASRWTLDNYGERYGQNDKYDFDMYKMKR